MVRRVKLTITCKSSQIWWQVHPPAGLPLFWWGSDQAPCGLQHILRGSRELRDEEQCLISVHHISTMEVPAEGTQATQSGPRMAKKFVPCKWLLLCRTSHELPSKHSQRTGKQVSFHTDFLKQRFINILSLWLWNEDIISARILAVERGRKPNSGGNVNSMNLIIFIKFQDFCAEEINGNSTKHTFSPSPICKRVWICLERMEKT